jgi:beta-lactamase class A
MLAFAAKLAGPLVALVAVAFPASEAVDRTPEHSFEENLARFTQRHVAMIPPGPAPPPLPSVHIPRPSEPARKDAFAAVGPQIDALLAEHPEAQLGVAVRWSNGETLYMRNANAPFPMASVAKVYMLVAYLERLQREQRIPDPEEYEQLTWMIEISDNDAAEEIWRALGGIEAMQGYLNRIGMPPMTEPALTNPDESAEVEAWGDTGQTAAQMSLFLARLHEGELLDDFYTRLAGMLLAGIAEDQTWGVPSGVEVLDPGATVLFKNGWYPDDTDDLWRINTAGIVVPDNGTQPYVIVVFGQGFASWGGGIEVVDQVAALVNRVMLS